MRGTIKTTLHYDGELRDAEIIFEGEKVSEVRAKIFDIEEVWVYYPDEGAHHMIEESAVKEREKEIIEKIQEEMRSLF